MYRPDSSPPALRRCEAKYNCAIWPLLRSPPGREHLVIVVLSAQPKPEDASRDDLRYRRGDRSPLTCCRLVPDSGRSRSSQIGREYALLVAADATGSTAKSSTWND